MRMRTVTIQEIIQDEAKINTFAKNNPINHSYREFVSFFQQRKKLCTNDITIGVYFSYGWMPRMLKSFDVDRIGQIVQIFDKAKQGAFPTNQELTLLRDCINNSLVGPSKLLHFINPQVFGIWDSRVFKYIEQRKPTQKDMKSIINFTDYHINLRQLINAPSFQAVNSSMNSKIGYPVSPIRACEYVMYTNG